MASRRLMAGLALTALALTGAPWAHADGPDTVMAIMPVFSQVIAWRLPSGFHRTNEVAQADHYLFEAVREGEMDDDWSQMVTLTGAAGLAANPELTPKRFASDIAAGLRRTCPDSYYGVELEPAAVAGYDTYAAVAGCGRVSGTEPTHGETMLIVAIKGAHDYYTLQWAERTRAQSKPPLIDAGLWSKRLAELMPIQVCDRVPGEKPPYPSCVSQIAKNRETLTAPVSPTAPAPPNESATDSDVVLTRWKAVGFALTLQHYLSTLASTCDSLPGAAAGGKGILQTWQGRARNGLFLDASRLYQTAFVAAVQKSDGEQAAQGVLARQMEVVRQQGDGEARKLLSGSAAENEKTCRRVEADVAAGEYDLGEGIPYYATLDRLSRELAADEATDKRGL